MASVTADGTLRELVRARTTVRPRLGAARWMGRRILDEAIRTGISMAQPKAGKRVLGWVRPAR